MDLQEQLTSLQTKLKHLQHQLHTAAPLSHCTSTHTASTCTNHTACEENATLDHTQSGGASLCTEVEEKGAKVLYEAGRMLDDFTDLVIKVGITIDNIIEEIKGYIIYGITVQNAQVQFLKSFSVGGLTSMFLLQLVVLLDSSEYM